MSNLKKFRPITPSQREMVVVTGDITKGVAPESSTLSEETPSTKPKRTRKPKPKEA